MTTRFPGRLLECVVAAVVVGASAAPAGEPPTGKAPSAASAPSPAAAPLVPEFLAFYPDRYYYAEDTVAGGLYWLPDGRILPDGAKNPALAGFEIIEIGPPVAKANLYIWLRQSSDVQEVWRVDILDSAGRPIPSLHSFNFGAWSGKKDSPPQRWTLPRYFLAAKDLALGLPSEVQLRVGYMLVSEEKRVTVAPDVAMPAEVAYGVRVAQISEEPSGWTRIETTSETPNAGGDVSYTLDHLELKDSARRDSVPRDDRAAGDHRRIYRFKAAMSEIAGFTFVCQPMRMVTFEHLSLAPVEGQKARGLFEEAMAKPFDKPKRAATAETPRIKCKVVDADGRPVAGAEVVAVDYGFDRDTFMGEAKVVERAATAADGGFSFAGPAREGWPQRIAVARKPGLAVGWLLDTGDRKIVLDKARTLSGRVADESGRPVAGADVRVKLGVIRNRCYYSLAWDTGPDWLTTRTDAGGLYVFSQVPRHAGVSLLFSAPGYARMEAPAGIVDPETLPCADEADNQVVLPREATLRGKVIEKATGRPVGGVKLVADHRAKQGARSLTMAAVTGEDGTFAIGGLLEGDYRVCVAGRAKMPDWVAAPIMAKATAAPAAGAAAMELVKGAVVEVAVTDRRTGRPIAGAAVELLPEQPGLERADSVTGSDGVGRARVMPGKYTMNSVDAPRYARENRRQDVEVGEGQTRRLEVNLEGLVLVEGTVLDEAGGPVEGAKVSLVHGGRTGDTTDAAGRFAIWWSPGAASGHDEIALVYQEDRGLAGAVVVPQDRRPTVTVHAGRNLAGRVVDPEGKPLPGAEVTATVVAGQYWHAPWWRGAATDRDGRYVLKAFPPEPKCKVSLSLSKAGYGSRDFVLGNEAKVALEDGKALTEAQDIVLERADQTISGIVLDTDGKPVAGAEVHAYSDPVSMGSMVSIATVASCLSGADGKFTLKGLVRKSYDVGATFPNGKGWAQAKVQAGEQDVRLAPAAAPPASPPAAGKADAAPSADAANP